jgi:type VI secretion system secreted protein Hcp
MPETQARQTGATRIKRPLLASALAIAATTIVAGTGPAFADTFLKLDGIEGESTDAKHKGEIDILSFTQSWINSGSSASGGGGGAGKVQCGAVTLMKNIDKSSPVLLKEVITGEHIRDGTITFEANNRQSAEYYSIKMTDVFVTELTQTDAADPNRIFEKLVLNARTFEFKYQPQSIKGQIGTPVSFKFDCATNKGA